MTKLKYQLQKFPHEWLWEPLLFALALPVIVDPSVKGAR
jgi:hypothetical protein